MKRVMLACAAMVGLVGLTGCPTVVAPVFGGIVNDAKFDGHANGPIGTKEGRACAKSYLGIVGTGDASIKAAAAAGGITNVTSVDHEVKHMVLIGDYCTIVRGN